MPSVANGTRQTGTEFRLVGLDGLRGVAALCVMGYHYTKGELGLFPSAPAAVDLFFALSGFVLAHTYEQRLARDLAPGRFLVLRLIRLYPLYICGALLGLLTTAAGMRWGIVPSEPQRLATAAVLAVAFLPSWSSIAGPLYPLDGPAWSLFFELIANTVFARWRPATRRIVWLCLAMLPLLVVASIVAHGPAGWAWMNALGGIPRVLFSFYLGVLFQRLYRRHGALLPRLPYWIFPALVLATLAVDPGTDWETGYYLLLATVVFPVLLLASVGSEPSPRQASFWSWLGGISYAVYVLHQPLQDAGRNLFGRIYPNTEYPQLLLLATAVLTIIISTVLSRYYDPRARRALTAMTAVPTAKPRGAVQRPALARHAAAQRRRGEPRSAADVAV